MVKCDTCNLCGKALESQLMCTLSISDENQLEKACWCVCSECKDSFIRNIDNAYQALIEGRDKGEV